MQQRPDLCEKWLEYLHALNLEQFDADVWLAMQAAHKAQPQLSPTAFKQAGNIQFSYKGMETLFLSRAREAPPHIVTGNKMRLSTAQIVLKQLFSQTTRFKRGP